MLRLDYERTKNLILPVNDLLISLHDSINALRLFEEAKLARYAFEKASIFDSIDSTIIPMTRIIYKSMQTGNSVISNETKHTDLSLISHDWWLKCIFFKWNMRKTLYFTFSPRYTHPSTLHLYVRFARRTAYPRRFVLQSSNWYHRVRSIWSHFQFQKDVKSRHVVHISGSMWVSEYARRNVEFLPRLILGGKNPILNKTGENKVHILAGVDSIACAWNCES